ncbi:MAG: MarR family transcriptional regulator [Myxacorys californica WJT36-NPBG1]|jgi:DNA-binding MarR family transcriptional regulator|nr:MarR family transcriptional regulator [Myxacorys californica WJT36-NPBG1]MBW4537512.1 MarR family transcriptional regulator [Myxacorys chilensis ATA2-1-KO14]
MSKKSITSEKLAKLNPQSAAKQPFMKTLRSLTTTYQAFCAYDEPHIRELGLTPPQFDVLCTLGNTSGMFMHQLAERTLVTKGTLTGIIDRLEQKGLVRREVPPENRRCFLIVLTPEGEQVFQDVFPAHISYLKERFDQLDAAELEQIESALQRLRQIFN